jgi:plasmid replication initiation protein
MKKGFKMSNVKTYTDNKKILRLHNNFVNSIFSLTTDAKKLLFAIWLHTNEDGQDIEIYRPDIIDKIGIDLKNLGKEHREEIIEELMTKIITIRDIDNPNNFTKIQLVGATKYKDGILSTNIDKELLKYIKEAQEKLFTRFNIQNIKPMRSGYAIRIYLLCKQFEDTGWSKIKLEDFKKQLEIEYKYKRMYDLKKYVLEVAKKQINENTDIIIDYELEKKGRKYTNIKFKITSKNKKIAAPKEAGNKITNNWNDWRKELLNKGNLIILFEDETFELKNNYLFKDKKLLSKEKSLELWQNLYENRDKLQIMNEDEYLQEQIKKAQEEENKYQKIKELKEQYEYLIVKINEEHKEVSVVDIQFDEEDNIFKLYMTILGENQTVYQPFKNLEELENFLKVCKY